MRVLITGATGEVARGVIPLLDKKLELRLLAADAPADDARYVRADILDRRALRQAMEDVDAVLHLAVASGHSGTFEDDDFNDRRFDVNVKGAYHVFETARLLGVRRVVHVSSVMVTWGHALARARNRQRKRIAGDAPAFPVGTYALTKALTEDIARYYASPRMRVITVRIAAPLDLTGPTVRARPVRPQQVPFADLAQAFTRALKVRLAKYEIVTVAGDSSRSAWDLGAARRVLGYRPRFRLDDLGLTFADPFDVKAK